MHSCSSVGGHLQVIRDEHASLAAMLQSMRWMVKRGPAEDRRAFFDVVRAMLFYIDEFPGRLHHPKESNLLFPSLVKASAQVMGAIGLMLTRAPSPIGLG